MRELTRQEFALMCEIGDTEGWPIFKAQMEEKIRSVSNNLVNAKFENLQEVGILQGRIQGIREVLNYIDNRLAERREKGV